MEWNRFIFCAAVLCRGLERSQVRWPWIALSPTETSQRALDWWLHWTNWDGCVISLVFGEAMEWTLRPEGQFCTLTSLSALVLTVNWSVQSGFACCSLCFGSKDWNLCFIWQLAPALVPLAWWLPCVSELGILSPQVWKARLWTKGKEISFLKVPGPCETWCCYVNLLVYKPAFLPLQCSQRCKAILSPSFLISLKLSLEDLVWLAGFVVCTSGRAEAGLMCCI